VNDSGSKLELSYSTRKALSVHLGEAAGKEVVDLLTKMAAQIDDLKRTKVSITPVIPQPKTERSPLAALDNEVF
jgi:hypothetical protein